MKSDEIQKTLECLTLNEAEIERLEAAAQELRGLYDADVRAYFKAIGQNAMNPHSSHKWEIDYISGPNAVFVWKDTYRDFASLRQSVPLLWWDDREACLAQRQTEKVSRKQAKEAQTRAKKFAEFERLKRELGL